MEKDNFVTEVIFRKFEDGEVIALFPYNVENYNGDIVSYMHVGQHECVDYNHVVNKTKLITNPEEYKELKNELENIGYNLKVIRKRNYDKFFKEYCILRKKYESVS